MNSYDPVYNIYFCYYFNVYNGINFKNSTKAYAHEKQRLFNKKRKIYWCCYRYFNQSFYVLLFK